MKIAWIGTGVMGCQMIKHLSNAGHMINVYNRSIDKANKLSETVKNVFVFKSIKEAINNVDIIFTMVGFPSDVEEVYLGEHGIFNNVANMPICIDMTTSSPKLAIKIHNKFLSKNINVLDAPVTGGEIGAINGQLSIMVGGNLLTFEKVKDLLTCFAKSVIYMGDSGSGQHTKMANQISIAGNIAGTCESLIYCINKKINLNKVFEVIKNGSGNSWQFSNNGLNIINKNFDPGFYAKHFLKDLKIAQQEILPIKLEILDNVIKMYEFLVNNGYQNYGSQILIKYYE